jgi:hypothetical protein
MSVGTGRGQSGEFSYIFDFLQQYLNDLVLKPPGFPALSKHLTPRGWEYQRCLARFEHIIAGIVDRAKKVGVCWSVGGSAGVCMTKGKQSIRHRGKGPCGVSIGWV